MSDKNITCKDCKLKFIFTASEEAYFKSKLKDTPFVTPVRCKECRAKKSGKQLEGNTSPNKPVTVFVSTAKSTPAPVTSASNVGTAAAAPISAVPSWKSIAAKPPAEDLNNAVNKLSITEKQAKDTSSSNTASWRGGTERSGAHVPAPSKYSKPANHGAKSQCVNCFEWHDNYCSVKTRLAKGSPFDAQGLVTDIKKTSEVRLMVTVWSKNGLKINQPPNMVSTIQQSCEYLVVKDTRSSTFDDKGNKLPVVHHNGYVLIDGNALTNSAAGGLITNASCILEIESLVRFGSIRPEKVAQWHRNMQMERYVASQFSTDVSFRVNKGLVDYHDMDNGGIVLVGNETVITDIANKLTSLLRQEKAARAADSAVNEEDKATECIAVHVPTDGSKTIGQSAKEKAGPRAIPSKISHHLHDLDTVISTGKQGSMKDIKVANEELYMLCVVCEYPDATEVGLPGGKRGLGETSLECAMREFQEETNMMIQLDKETATNPTSMRFSLNIPLTSGNVELTGVLVKDFAHGFNNYIMRVNPV